ncbi:MAG: hypothetical protein LBK28_07135 [Propionibacteriaceae bacterium]|jgi:hypothetical protein|nr:hypothetical protein [Propionibacteriaceae bacterium]
MTSVAVWEQVEALPLREQFELAERIQDTVPEIPSADLAELSREELRAMLDESYQHAIAHPETLITVEESARQFRQRRPR